MKDLKEKIENAEEMLQKNPHWHPIRKWSLESYICQLKGIEIPPHPLEGKPQPTISQPTLTKPQESITKKISTPSTSKPTTSKPVKPSKAMDFTEELKKKQAEGKLKPSEIKKEAKKKKTLKEWLEDGKISEEKYDLLNQKLDQDTVFSLAEINAKYWELKDKE